LAGLIPENIIREVVERADILEVVEKYVPLKKKGRNFMGLCPFHSEKTASFSVSPDKGFFKCFGCGKGGTALTFLMEMEGITFPEAVRELGDRYGVRIETATKESKKKDDKRKKLYAINNEAERFFLNNLRIDIGKGAVDYLKKRGIDGITARDFSLGYSPKEWEALIKYSKHKGISENQLKESGLVIMGDRGPYDRFRGRIIFPIKNQNGRLCGFGGRIIGDGEPKYMNSPETPIYHKGEILYGLNITKNEIRKAQHAIIVEGYLDSISLYQAGIKNVAATLGTALTQDHLRAIKRYTNEVVLLFDADEAGGMATERTLPLFGEGTMYAKSAVLPKGEDPDSFIREKGVAAFQKIIANAKDIFDFCLERIYSRHDLNTAKGETEALDEASYVAAVKKLPNEVDFYVRKIAERLGVGEQSVRDSVSKKMKRESRNAAIQSRHQKKESEDKPKVAEEFNPPNVESRLFKMAVNYPHLLQDAGLTDEHLEHFTNLTLKGLVENILKAEHLDNKVHLASLISSGESSEGAPELTQKIIDLSTLEDEEVTDEEMANEIIGDCIKNLDVRDLKTELKSTKRRLLEANKDETKEEASEKFVNIKKNMKR
jgi:DNA primase